MKRVVALIEDDWELQGNGSGNVAHLQYLPTVFLLDLADELGMKLTFMAEAMQQLVLRQHASADRNVRIQADLWDETVRLIKERGHDVQLHLHPQWHGAEYREGAFRVTKGWNIAAYPSPLRCQMLADAIGYLTELLTPVDPEYRIHSFKAGSWGLQPSGDALRDLEAAGIRIVLGVGRGIRYVTADFSADYSGLEEDLLPYYPEYDDVQRVSAQEQRIVVLPLPHYVAGPVRLARQVTRKLARRGRPAPDQSYYSARSATSATLASPMGPRRIDRRELVRNRGDIRTLDIGSADFGELRLAIDQIMRRCLAAEAEIVPLVLQSHTKAYPGNWENLERFFRYLVERYGSVLEFQTYTGFLPVLSRMPIVRKAADAH